MYKYLVPTVLKYCFYGARACFALFVDILLKDAFEYAPGFEPQIID